MEAVLKALTPTRGKFMDKANLETKKVVYDL